MKKMQEQLQKNNDWEAIKDKILNFYSKNNGTISWKQLEAFVIDLLQTKRCKEADTKCACWLDGFQVSEAENGFEWKQELIERINGHPAFSYKNEFYLKLEDIIAIIQQTK